MRVLRSIVVALGMALALIAAHPALAVQPDEVLKDPVLETRARELSRELRCMVCQNQSIDDSDAPLARDLRVLVRERLSAGDSNPQVIDYLVARYGEFVLLRPRFEWHTLVLWLAGPVILAVGAIALFLAVRRRKDTSPAAMIAAEPKLTPEQEAKLARLVKEES
jgi:cytochrome c-type biogenesis protein CcmH